MDNPFEAYIETVQELVALDGKSELASYISESNVEAQWVSHDNWNSGTDFYNLIVKIPVKVFARMRAHLEEEEETIYKAFVDTMHDADESIRLSAVKIVPNKDALPSDMPQLDDISMWKYNYFRLFISHLTADKTRAASLKSILERCGIDCFVAHEDITPSKEWQKVIESALGSMDAMCAIITPDFNKSKWCDQEVGFALGRRRIVIPIDSGAIPYGFIGKWQAIPTKDKSRQQVADAIFNAICINELTRGVYLEKLVNLIISANKKDEAIHFLEVLQSIENVEKRYIDNLYTHYTSNNTLMLNECLKVANVIFEHNGYAKITKQVSKTNTELQNFDLPF